jgi:hypothetical protein
MPISDENIVFVIFMVKLQWYEHDYLVKCEEWAMIANLQNFPFILGVYHHQDDAERMVELLNQSQSQRIKNRVNIYYQGMTESGFLALVKDTCKKRSEIGLLQTKYLDNIKYNCVYCNGMWINAYELICRIERQMKKKNPKNRPNDKTFDKKLNPYSWNKNNSLHVNISENSDRDYMNSDYLYIDYLSDEECALLVDYFDSASIKENTNNINVNPTFNNRVIYYESVKDPKVKALMKRIHTDVAARLKDFYHETGDILPEATHIVKWPIGTSLGNHADNAYEDGRPNYVSWRTYSAIIYLNDDFLGGEFYFKKYAYDLKPKKGLLVGFTAGLRHVHGVRQVNYGIRYTLPMWFCGQNNKQKALVDN